MWFNVDDKLHTSPARLMIPKRWRAHAIGVWCLCGSYSSDNLTDGYVPEEVFKEHGGTDAIRKYLTAAGFLREDSQVVLTAQHNRIRSAAEAQAERNRIANAVRSHRKGGRNGSDLGKQSDVTPLHGESSNGVTSQRGGNGSLNGSLTNPPPSKAELLPKSGTALARPTMEISRLCGNDPEPLPVPPPDRHIPAEANELVKAAVPASVWGNQKPRWGLLTQTATLLNGGADEGDVRAALQTWVSTPDVYPGHLPHMMTEVIKKRTNGRTLQGADKKAAGWQSLKRRDTE